MNSEKRRGKRGVRRGKGKSEEDVKEENGVERGIKGVSMGKGEGGGGKKGGNNKRNRRSKKNFIEKFENWEEIS